ncbi:hypothetical protein BWQ96_05461 [Gracilariopsis chorda]|uniref:Uncharacterized protein n=1 Tax=Gracilariopsis chorda TaxID=448386 RepID=A0A2V3IRN8_9FLOR|nr:hypothetical protein BWQ96_05461 [Gracilariopsis chorda]|eukprot:PXF44791.1 hypothetical protein BWQ96_05461 [Gracilariopsis chorda]
MEVNFPEWNLVRPLQSSTGGFMFEHLFDYGNVRYHDRIQKNHNVQQCTENNLLSQVDGFFEEKDLGSIEDVIGECFDLFWPFIQLHAEEYDGQSIVRLQLITVDGELQLFEHDEEFKE